MSIYTIYKATNIINEKSYIGFASNLPKRISRHKTSFNNQTNNNYKSAFYSALRKYGWDNFTWEVLYQSKDKHHTLNEMENYFICEYKSYGGFVDCNGYNMTLGGDGTFGKILKSYKSYVFLNENNDIIKIHNLNKFCTENNLNYNSMVNVANGHKKSHKKYKNINCISYTPNNIDKIYKFISPDGSIIEINNLYSFCIENNLEVSSMYNLSNNKIKFYKNYKNINYPEYIPKKYKVFKFLKDSNIIEIINLKKFCVENSLGYTCMLDVYYEKQKSHRGYIKCQIQ